MTFLVTLHIDVVLEVLLRELIKNQKPYLSFKTLTVQKVLCVKCIKIF